MNGWMDEQVNEQMNEKLQVRMWESGTILFMGKPPLSISWRPLRLSKKAIPLPHQLSLKATPKCLLFLCAENLVYKNTVV